MLISPERLSLSVMVTEKSTLSWWLTVLPDSGEKESMVGGKFRAGKSGKQPMENKIKNILKWGQYQGTGIRMWNILLFVSPENLSCNVIYGIRLV